VLNVTLSHYKSTLLDSETYLLTCQCYIEMNPVRAGMVDHPSDYPWSSYACNAIGKPAPMISPHDLYLQLGDNDDARQANYRALFDVPIETRELDEIRHATNKSWVLGSDKFKERIEAVSARQVQPKARGGDRKSKQYRDNSPK